MPRVVWFIGVFNWLHGQRLVYRWNIQGFVVFKKKGGGGQGPVLVFIYYNFF